MATDYFEISEAGKARILRLRSADGTNRLSRSCVLALGEAIQYLAARKAPLLLAGNQRFFCAGADLTEIARLTAAQAYEFSKMGQELMNRIEAFPAPVYAAVEGYCMGGGLDLALACHLRIASPHAIFGHRGAALGLVTGWGGTQRLPRLIGRSRALQMFVLAEKVHARQALEIGLIHSVIEDPVEFYIQSSSAEK